MHTAQDTFDVSHTRLYAESFGTAIAIHSQTSKSMHRFTFTDRVVD